MKAIVKNIHMQFRKTLFQLFTVFGELSKCFLTSLWKSSNERRNKERKGWRKGGGREKGKKGERKEEREKRKRTENRFLCKLS